MNILHTYIPFSKNYKQTRGLSERQIKKRLERDGWMVWRGGSVNLIGKTDLYPNVERKYGILKALLAVHKPNSLDELAYLCTIHHGLPDFICYRNTFKFVECKYKNEQLSKAQKVCFQKLRDLGFPVEVYKFVDHTTKMRRCLINILTGHKIIKEHQLRLKLRWKNSRKSEKK